MYHLLLRTLYGDRAYRAPFGWRIRPGADHVASSRTFRLPRWAWAVALLAAFVSLELRTSWLQSMVLARAARHLTYTVEPGTSASIRFPASGPYDIRLGYDREPEFVTRLEARGFYVEAQAR